MADQKLTALTELDSPALSDILYAVDDPGGSPLSRKVTIENVLKLLSILYDTSPQLGGNLDLNQFSIELDPTPASNVTGNGLILTMTVDTNAVGIGCGLYMAADGHFDEADADAAATMPCIACALETSTGSKKVLFKGAIRNDSWSWASLGQPVYVSETQGLFTQTSPGTGKFSQRVGIVIASNIILFDPDKTIIEVA